MKLKKLEKLRANLRKCEDALRHYKKLFAADGQVDKEEQDKLDKLQSDIKSIMTEIDTKEKELSTSDRNKNALKANEEAKADWSSSEDDEVDPKVLDEAPTNTGSSINGSVGKKGDNNKADVTIVQNLLKEKNNAPLKGSGVCGPKTIKAIKEYQTKVGISESGIIAPNDETWKKLSGSSSGETSDDDNTDDTASTGSSIGGSVGKKGDNNKADVTVVQNLLKEKNNAPLKGSGVCGPKTIKAIKEFQTKVGISETGLIAPNDDTWKKLNDASSSDSSDDNGDDKPEDKGILAQATRYGYSSDPYANQNDREARGNNNNKLTPGLSVALSPELYQQLGLGRKSGGYVFVTFESGTTKKFQTADQTAKGLTNLRVDFFDPKGEYKSVDGQKLWVKVASGSGSSEDASSGGGEQPDNSSLSIQKSVGKKGKNKMSDVKIVQKLLKEKGADLKGLGICGPKTIRAIEAFQSVNMNGFSDGLIDPGGRTWKLLTGNGKPIDSSSDDGNSGGDGGPLSKPNWIKIAEGEKGVKENTSKTKHDPRVMEYHGSVGGNINTDETPWCSSFVNWVMKKAGKGGTNSAMAISWKKYGKKLDRPAYGAIAVIDWDGPGPGWKGHVGFVVGKKGSSILMLGGNQANAVNVKSFPKSKIVAYVVPSGYEVPQSAYSFGESNGNFDSGGDVNSTR